jgi:peptide/nickel transport system substrate-binding protein
MRSADRHSARRSAWTATIVARATISAGSAPTRGQGVLKVGMTAADLPITTGNPDKGFEGYRFVGYNL